MGCVNYYREIYELIYGSTRQKISIGYYTSLAQGGNMKCNQNLFIYNLMPPLRSAAPMKHVTSSALKRQ